MALGAFDQGDHAIDETAAGILAHLDHEPIREHPSATGDGGPVKGITVSYVTKDAGEAKRVFDALAEGGEVTAPLSETFFSPSFGMCVDKFGVPWMVNAEAAQ